MTYLPLEKLVLVLVITTRKLMHYFQAHSIAIYRKFPLNNMLMRIGLLRRLSKWVVKLRQFNIKLLPKAAIRGKVLANFVIEFLSRTMSP